MALPQAWQAHRAHRQQLWCDYFCNSGFIQMCLRGLHCSSYSLAFLSDVQLKCLFFKFPFTCCVCRLDEWANLHLPLCRGGRDEPHPVWAGVHRGDQSAHENPWDPQGGPREASRAAATSTSPSHSHKSDAGAREDRCGRWGHSTAFQDVG